MWSQLVISLAPSIIELLTHVVDKVAEVHQAHIAKVELKKEEVPKSDAS